MAQQITLVDDIDGSTAAESIEFGLDGKNYTIDLSEKNAGKLRKAMEDFIAKAQPVAAPAPTKAGRKASKSAKSKKGNHDLNEVREWGRANGYEISDRGRVPNTVLEAFDAAKKGAPTEAPAENTDETKADAKEETKAA